MFVLTGLPDDFSPPISALANCAVPPTSLAEQRRTSEFEQFSKIVLAGPGP